LINAFTGKSSVALFFCVNALAVQCAKSVVKVIQVIGEAGPASIKEKREGEGFKRNRIL
jgi:hypothetical protein